ncbi:hypothetical protein HK101_001762 [Irineochytrium annulatum]|nr:hypothetical protein HK101_001762 [Irineochytrium annulatum]
MEYVSDLCVGPTARLLQILTDSQNDLIAHNAKLCLSRIVAVGGEVMALQTSLLQQNDPWLVLAREWNDEEDSSFAFVSTAVMKKLKVKKKKPK